jgi:hypothetical protein
MHLESTVKKGIVVLLLGFALVVTVSPGIIGRLAEQSVEQGFDQAANDSGEFVVTTTGFDRGWFTSAGQYRVALGEGDLYYLLLAAFDDVATDTLPVLLIDTRLDHGLIPVSSMQREHGSLMPGLGNAVSTLRLEFADGSLVPLPGKLYSTISLLGELQTRVVLQADGLAAGDLQLDWGDAEFLLTSTARSGSVGIRGSLQSLAVASAGETAIFGLTGVDLQLAPSGYGFRVGAVKLTLDSFAAVSAATSTTAGPLYLQSNSAMDGEYVHADLTMRLENTPLPLGGNGALELVLRLANVDAAALGILQRNADAARSAAPGQLAAFDMQRDLMRLLARGMRLDLDQLDINGPFGQISSRFSATLAPTDPDDFNWPAALLALDASADISVPAALVDMLTQNNPEMLAAIGMGFLRKKGDYYVLEAAFKQGLLNVNGAPMPIPLTGLQ